MFVNVTRGDLRDEFSMADEAFALSPISARAAQPSEQDYDAISEAFMETSRGRWFLGEYAKRNRNADTHMVLDAVARIEQSLAAQRRPEPEPVQEPVLDTGLADAIAAIKAALGEARTAATAAIDSLALEQHLAPVRKGARVIREISWRWREIGADGRICDLLDSQVSAIEASCAEISSADPHTALGAAFDLIGHSIAAFDESDATPTKDAQAEDIVEAAASPSPAPSNEMPAADIEPAEPLAIVAEAAGYTRARSAETVPVEEPVVTAQAVAEAPVEAAEEVAEAADLSAEDADAHDEAVLDMIAAEMAAYDPSDEDGDADIDGYETQHAEQPAAEPAMVASTAGEISEETSEQVAEKMQVAEETSVAPQIAPAVEVAAAPPPLPAPEPEAEPSLGESLIANGLLRMPATAGPDPLAAIRRLSQIEKIALFS
jgi:hypothetical protein